MPENCFPIYEPSDWKLEPPDPKAVEELKAEVEKMRRGRIEYRPERLTPEDVELISRRLPGEQIIPVDFDLPTTDPDC